MNINKIINNIWLGVSISNYDLLSQLGIRYVIDVRGEYNDDVTELSKLGIGYFKISIPDWQAPRSDQIALFLKLINLLGKDDIYIHCAVGKGRSASLVVIYLIEFGYAKTIEEASQIIKDAGNIIQLDEQQMNKVNFYIKNKKGE
jgi:protein-tyrosine phosphatase